MRVEPFAVGSYLHVLKRGARGIVIVGDDDDRWRFVRSLFHLNDAYFDEKWVLEKYTGGFFERPSSWPPRKPLVSIISYTLMPNHFHLILREIQEGGTSLFMKKLGQSMTNHFNEKYDEKGTIFQGAYKSRTIKDDRQMRYAIAYVIVKNTFELYPNGGLKDAMKDFETAWHWAIEYPFSSLSAFCGKRSSPIVDKSLLSDMFETPHHFKIYAQDVILGGKWFHADFE